MGGKKIYLIKQELRLMSCRSYLAFSHQLSLLTIVKPANANCSGLLGRLAAVRSLCEIAAQPCRATHFSNPPSLVRHSYDAHLSFSQLSHLQVKQRIIDVDTKNSLGLVGCIEELSHNALAVYWNPLDSPAKVNLAVQCLSTDFRSAIFEC